MIKSKHSCYRDEEGIYFEGRQQHAVQDGMSELPSSNSGVLGRERNDEVHMPSLRSKDRIQDNGKATRSLGLLRTGGTSPTAIRRQVTINYTTE